VRLAPRLSLKYHRLQRLSFKRDVQSLSWEDVMKGMVSVVVLLSTLFVGEPAQAGPVEDCNAVRKNREQAFNDRNWDKLVGMHTKDILFFAVAVNEVIVGTDALRNYYSTIIGPRDSKIRIGEHAATQAAPNVVLCSGYLVATIANNNSVTRESLVLVNTNGTWLIAQAHFSRLQK
jgi:ketosteroid isomerase-like protein